MSGKHALVYGGSGALGRIIVSTFRQQNWTVTSVDRKINPEAHHNVTVAGDSSSSSPTSSPSSSSWSSVYQTVSDALVRGTGAGMGGGTATTVTTAAAAEGAAASAATQSGAASHVPPKGATTGGGVPVSAVGGPGVGDKKKAPTMVDVIICVAGGWCGGNAATSDFVQTVETSILQSVQSSTIAAHLAATHLKENGLLVLTGSHAALEPTPGMIGYGMAKAAVHHLVHSVGAPKGGLPSGTKTIGILPITLDTPNNRQAMPEADYSTWTPLSAVAEQLSKWAADTSLVPLSGTLYEIVTKDGTTTFNPVKRGTN